MKYLSKFSTNLRKQFLIQGVVALAVVFKTLIGFNAEAQNCNANFLLNVQEDQVSVLDSPASGQSATHKWDMGDNTTYTKDYFYHTYQQNGEYEICHYVKDSGSAGVCHDTVCKKVFIYAPCDPKFTFDKSGKTVQFYDSSNMADSLYHVDWDFGDGHTSKKNNPKHTYNKDGSYYVCLTVTDTAGASIGCQKNYCLNITINDCQAGFNYVDSGLTVSFRDQSNYFSNNKQHQWDFGDGHTSSKVNPSHTFDSTGTYQVCQVIKGDNCVDTLCDSVKVIASDYCNADFTYCNDNNKNVSFTNQSTGSALDSLEYFWDFGDGHTSTKEDPEHTYDSFGNYFIELILTTHDGQCSDTITKKVPVHASCEAKFTYKKSANGNYSFTNQSTSQDSLNYYWDFGDGHTSTKENPTHKFDTLGAFNVKLIVTTTRLGQCSDTFTSKVPVSNTISGDLYKDSGYMTKEKVALYRYDSSQSSYQLYKTQNNIDSGWYYFTNLQPGKYLVKAIPDTTSNYVPTYHDSVITWQNAIETTLQEYGNSYDKDIWLQKQKSNKNGNSTLSGTLTYGGPNKRGGEGDPVVDAQVLLLDEEGDLLQMTYTNEEGKYVFENLTPGTYHVHAEITGYTIEKATVTLDEDGESEDEIDFEVEEAEKAVHRTTFIEKAGKEIKSLKIYPNPAANEQVHLEFKDAEITNLKATLVNMQGQAMVTKHYKLNNGERSVTFEVGQVNEGIYLLRLQDEQSRAQQTKLIHIR